MNYHEHIIRQIAISLAGSFVQTSFRKVRILFVNCFIELMGTFHSFFYNKNLVVIEQCKCHAFFD